MTITYSTWQAWVIVGLMLIGAFAVLYAGWEAASGVVAWWRDRHDDDGPDPDDWPDEVEGDWLEQLPPERPQDHLGFSRLAVEAPQWASPELPAPALMRANERLRALNVQRERRMAPYEAEARQAYASMGFEFPSGLLARVRELTP